MKLSQKHLRFADEYLIDFNKARAAKAAGYSEKGAEQRADILLARQDIKDYLTEKQPAASADNNQTTLADKVIKELCSIAFASAADYVKIVSRPDENGIMQAHIEYVDTDKLPNNAKASIISIKNTKDGIRIEAADKHKALELLGKHLGLFSEKSQTTMQLNISEEDRELLNKLGHRYAYNS